MVLGFGVELDVSIMFVKSGTGSGHVLDANTQRDNKLLVFFFYHNFLRNNKLHSVGVKERGNKGVIKEESKRKDMTKNLKFKNKIKQKVTNSPSLSLYLSLPLEMLFIFLARIKKLFFSHLHHLLLFLHLLPYSSTFHSLDHSSVVEMIIDNW